jgi:predicted metal-dependent phosphoesterase TrpH
VRRLKTVFHVHTDYSDDSDNNIGHLLDAAARCGVDVMAVTDHDTLDGARALADEAPPGLTIIVGQEISTTDGHLIGLFLHEAIAPGLPVRATAREVQRQGGLVVVPHPFNIMFGCGLREAVYDVIDLIDIVEVSNAQNLLPFPNRKAGQFANFSELPMLVGADSHHRDSLCASYQLLPPFDSPVSFLAAVNQALLVPGRHTLGYFTRSAMIVLRDRLGLPAPAGYGANCHSSRRRVPLPRPVCVSR